MTSLRSIRPTGLYTSVFFPAASRVFGQPLCCRKSFLFSHYTRTVLHSVLTGSRQHTCESFSALPSWPFCPLPPPDLQSLSASPGCSQDNLALSAVSSQVVWSTIQAVHTLSDVAVSRIHISSSRVFLEKLAWFSASSLARPFRHTRPLGFTTSKITPFLSSISPSCPSLEMGPRLRSENAEFSDLFFPLIILPCHSFNPNGQ